MHSEELKNMRDETQLTNIFYTAVGLKLTFTRYITYNYKLN